jgi:hypothetical protein
MTLEDAGRELVDRARHGDQNAMATMVRVRENAKKGVAKAQQALQYMLAYAQGHVRAGKGASGSATVHGAPLKKLKSKAVKAQTARDYVIVVYEAPACESLECAAEILSRGPTVAGETLSLIGATFGSDPEKQAFQYGVMGPPEGVRKGLKTVRPPFARAMRTGYVMGRAGRLQAARNGNIAALSRRAAWELT